MEDKKVTKAPRRVASTDPRSRYSSEGSASDGTATDEAHTAASKGRSGVIAVHGEAAPGVRKPFYRSLYFQVLTAIVLGGAIGHFWPEFGESLNPLGDVFF